jgi:hypothetical protein
MKQPMSDKTEAMKDAIEHFFPGTRQALAAGKCPLCRKPILAFRDLLSAKEFEISGMCQECQDDVFGENNED